MASDDYHSKASGQLLFIHCLLLLPLFVGSVWPLFLCSTCDLSRESWLLDFYWLLEVTSLLLFIGAAPSTQLHTCVIKM